MRFLVVSDLHLDKDASRAIAQASKEIPYTFVGGDIGLRRNERPENIVNYMWNTFHSTKTYLTPGNHDFWPVNIVKLYGGPPDVRVVVDQRVQIWEPEAKKLHTTWFSPWSTQFADWNWMRGPQEDDYDIPSDIRMVVTHGPVHGICDECPNGDHAGSYGLMGAIRDTNAKVIFSGHIHGNDYAHVDAFDRTWYNTSVLDERYRFKGKLPVFDTDTQVMEYWDA